MTESLPLSTRSDVGLEQRRTQHNARARYQDFIFYPRTQLQGGNMTPKVTEATD